MVLVQEKQNENVLDYFRAANGVKYQCDIRLNEINWGDVAELQTNQL